MKRVRIIVEEKVLIDDKECKLVSIDSQVSLVILGKEAFSGSLLNQTVEDNAHKVDEEIKRLEKKHKKVERLSK
jgi:hypothetical protein